MAHTKEEILAEIRRTAIKNNGSPLGMKRFRKETGIRDHDWRGRYWTKWSSAIIEAGYKPPSWVAKSDNDIVLKKLVSVLAVLKRFPTQDEFKMKRQSDVSFPSMSVIRRLGSTRKVLAKEIIEYCERHPGNEAVRNICALEAIAPEESGIDNISHSTTGWGFVYLFRSGRNFKIGMTNSVGRRAAELAIQLPEKPTLVHEIRTDDPAGIEKYWHERFKDRRKGGEWFELTKEDVSAFRRRKFM